MHTLGHYTELGFHLLVVVCNNIVIKQKKSNTIVIMLKSPVFSSVSVNTTLFTSVYELNVAAILPREN